MTPSQTTYTCLSFTELKIVTMHERSTRKELATISTCQSNYSFEWHNIGNKTLKTCIHNMSQYIV